MKRFWGLGVSHEDFDRYAKLANRGRFTVEDTIEGPKKTNMSDERFRNTSDEFVENPNELKYLEKLMGRNITDEDFTDGYKLKDKNLVHKLKALRARKALADFLLYTRSKDDANHYYDPETLAVVAGIMPDKIDEYIDGDSSMKEIYNTLRSAVPDELYSEHDADMAKGKREQDALEDSVSKGVLTKEEAYPAQRNMDAGDYWRYELHPYDDEPYLSEEEQDALGKAHKELADETKRSIIEAISPKYSM